MKKKVFLAGLAMFSIVILIVAIMINQNTNKPNINIPKAQKNILALNYRNYQISKPSDIYQTTLQKDLQKQLTRLQNQKNYTFENMLTVNNPFLTHDNRLYIHFNSKNKVKLSYTVLVDGEKSFTRDLQVDNKEYSKKHSHLITGIIPNKKNKITFTVTDKQGVKKTHSIYYHAHSSYGLKDNKTNKAKTSKILTGLNNTLYAVIGDQKKDGRSTYFLDKWGIVRDNIPISGYNSLRVKNYDNKIYLAINTHEIIQLNRFGKMIKKYDVGDKYQLHHDYEIDSKGNIIALATDLEKKKSKGYVEDNVIKIDSETGKTKRLFDFEDLLPDLYKKAKHKDKSTNNKGYYDVIHANSIKLVDDSTVIISSRETSTIFKISDINHDQAKIDYMIADSSIWKNIGDYGQKLLNKESEFQSQSGQHSVNYIPTSDPEVYYLEMFNNNSHIMDSRPDFDWSKFKGNKSYYYKYKVDEHNHTYKLVNKIAVPYSRFISSVQTYKSNIIIDSGMSNQLLVYNQDNKKIGEYKVNDIKDSDGFIYRIYPMSVDEISS